MSRFVVVLTGGIGSGKSLVADCFEQHGITIVEQDDVSREVVEPGEPALQSIESHFGSDVLNVDDTLNRGELRRRIFNNQEARRWLEGLLHPAIGLRTHQHPQTAGSKYAMVVNPLLNKRTVIYDRFLVVDAPVETQLQRTISRDHIDLKLAKSM